MYLYGFNRYSGFDRVFILNNPSILNKKLLKIKEGDLVKIQGDLFLVLGEEISFKEQYQKAYAISGELEVIYKGFFSSKYMHLLHWMVYQRYSTYKSVMRYFLPADLEDVMKYKIVKKKKNVREGNRQYTVIYCPELASGHIIDDKKCFVEIMNPVQDNEAPGNLSTEHEGLPGQSLIVFPDLWTLMNMIKDEVLKDKNTLFQTSNDTKKQKSLAWWKIKQGEYNLILTTHSEIFQDFSRLSQIVIINPETWYYSNQQDPRYKTYNVLSQIAKIWDVGLLKY